MKRLARVLELALEVVTVALLAALLAIVVGGVAFRTLGRSLGWYDEIASVLLAWLTFFGAALAALRRAHLGFSELVLRLSARARIALFAVSELVVIAFFAVVTVYGWRVLGAVGFDTLASVPWISQALVQSIIPIGGALYLCAELLSLPSAIAGLRAGIDPEAQARDEAIRQAQASDPGAAHAAKAPARG